MVEMIIVYNSRMEGGAGENHEVVGFLICTN